MAAKRKAPTVDLEQIRLAVITALCSDDVLMERLVLKGGNALALIYRVGSRASLDLDYSIEGDFEDVGDIKARLDHVITNAFAAKGLSVFDTGLAERPELRPGQKMHKNWGGYQYTFKLIPMDLAAELGDNLQAMRSQSIPVAPASARTFKVDISRYEVCPEKQSVDLDALQLFVYSPAMLAAEKLRAICQQDPEYPLRGRPAPRARDFFDVHTIVEKLHVDVSTRRFAELLTTIFEAKSVPLEYLGRIAASREFHRTDWPSVNDSIWEEHEGFDHYFDFVLTQIARIPLE